jgi:hypothetical protein
MNNDLDSCGLRAAFERSLTKFLLEAKRTHELMLALKNFPTSLQEQRAIFEQRMMETAAFRDYYLARARFFKAACRKELSG